MMMDKAKCKISTVDFEMYSKLTEDWIDKNIDSVKKYIFPEASTDSDCTYKEEDGLKRCLTYVALEVHKYLSDVEMSVKREIHANRIHNAQERGIHFGRQRKEIPAEFYPLYFKYKNGEISSRDGGSTLGISHSTFLKWVREIDVMSDNK